MLAGSQAEQVAEKTNALAEEVAQLKAREKQLDAAKRKAIEARDQQHKSEMKQLLADVDGQLKSREVSGQLVSAVTSWRAEVCFVGLY